MLHFRPLIVYHLGWFSETRPKLWIKLIKTVDAVVVISDMGGGGRDSSFDLSDCDLEGLILYISMDKTTPLLSS